MSNPSSCPCPSKEELRQLVDGALSPVVGGHGAHSGQCLVEFGQHRVWLIFSAQIVATDLPGARLIHSPFANRQRLAIRSQS